MAEIAVLIPAYNEADYIQRTVRAVANALPSTPIWVLDDNSSDQTAEEAERAGAQVIRLGTLAPIQHLHDKAHALWFGWTRISAKLYLFLDADLGETACHVPLLLEPVFKGEADMSIAVLPPAGKGGGFGLVLRLARGWLRWKTGQRFRAPLSGQRALRREVLEALKGFAPGYGLEVGLTQDASKAGFRIVEVEVPFTHRQLGRTWRGFRHRAKQMGDVIRAMLGKRISR